MFGEVADTLLTEAKFEKITIIKQKKKIFLKANNPVFILSQLSIGLILKIKKSLAVI